MVQVTTLPLHFPPLEGQSNKDHHLLGAFHTLTTREEYFSRIHTAILYTAPKTEETGSETWNRLFKVTHSVAVDTYIADSNKVIRTDILLTKVTFMPNIKKL